MKCQLARISKRLVAQVLPKTLSLLPTWQQESPESPFFPFCCLLKYSNLVLSFPKITWVCPFVWRREKGNCKSACRHWIFLQTVYSTAELRETTELAKQMLNECNFLYPLSSVYKPTDWSHSLHHSLHHLSVTIVTKVYLFYFLSTFSGAFLPALINKQAPLYSLALVVKVPLLVDQRFLPYF